MKRITAILMCVLMLIGCASCGEDTNGGADSAYTGPINVDIDIRESNYVTYINEIFTNTSDYIGDIIRLEGMFKAEHVQQTNKSYYYVYRTGPGCCGNDGDMCGFEFTWDKISTLSDNDWIEVIGTLRTYTEEGLVSQTVSSSSSETTLVKRPRTFLTLDAISVTVKSQRGAEVVAL